MALATKSPSLSVDALEGGGPGIVNRIYGALRRAPIWIIVAVWTIPTLGLFVNSFRTRDAQRRVGWWQTLTEGTTEATAEEGEAAANTFTAGPLTMEQLTTENYETVLAASTTTDLFGSLVNSAAIAIPATIIPIAIAAFAAYGFAWIDFKGRKTLFIGMVALLAVPLQVALLPLLRSYIGGAHWTVGSIGTFEPLGWIGIEKTVTVLPALQLNGTAESVWLTHTGFAMPFAIFLLHNYISGLPKDIFESARIDGADHFTIFWRLILPLSIPVLAAFAIFQFLWTWNDFLIARTMLGPNQDVLPTTVRIANLSGDFGRNDFILPAAAFIQAFIPLAVFFSLQRFFVRGILAGSVKG